MVLPRTGATRRALHAVVVRGLAPIARHPLATVVTGVGLLLSGLVELASEIFTGFETRLSAYHGVIVLGLVTGLRGLADMIEGVEWLSKEAEASLEQRSGLSSGLSRAARLPPDGP